MNQPPVFTKIPLPCEGDGDEVTVLAFPPTKTPRHRLVAWLIVGPALLLATGVGLFMFWANSKVQSYDLSLIEHQEVGCEIVNQQGASLARLFLQDRIPVTTDDYPPSLVVALTATEDSDFFDHRGFDVRGILRAITVNLRSGRVRQGGSTITQQLARMIYPLPGKTLDRKWTEVFLAARIEAAFDKDTILECYVNNAYMGSGFWGMGAAARGYFAKDLRHLSISEVALLCGIIKRPAAYSPFNDPALARAARNRTLERMAQMGHLTSKMASALCEEPLTILPLRQQVTGPQHAARPIMDEATSLLSGRDIPIDGCIIQTGIDLKLQEAAEQITNRVLAEVEQSRGYAHPVYGQTTPHLTEGRTATSYLQAAVVVIDNQTGNIVAQLGGRDLNDSQFDRCALGRRPPGAAFLPFVFAAAFESPHLSPSSLVIDAPINNRQVMIGGSSGVLGEWSAGPAGSAYEGEITAGYALLRSKNAATVRFGSSAGLDRVLQLAEAAGIRSKLRQYPSTFLGSSEVSLLELTRAYTIFPALGRRPAIPTRVDKITRASGAVLYRRPPAETGQALSAVSAAQVSALLAKSLDSGEARSRFGLNLNHAAGQSGTAYQFTDSWFVGFNAHYTCGVWVGFDLPRPIYPEPVPREIALPIWAEIMNALPGEDTPLPTVSAGLVELCLRSGQRASNSCRKLHPALVCAMPMPPAKTEHLQICQIHSGGSLPPRPNGPPEVRIEGAVPVIPKSPVVMGADPYSRPSNESGVPGRP